MEIKGKVHCLFEQSGTFKNEFIKLGYEAEDYDIQNHFGQTDHIMDLFAEIEKAYNSQPSVFDQFRGGRMVTLFWHSSHVYTSLVIVRCFFRGLIKITRT